MKTLNRILEFLLLKDNKFIKNATILTILASIFTLAASFGGALLLQAKHGCFSDIVKAIIHIFI